MGSHAPPQPEEDLEVRSDPVEFALFQYVRLGHGDNAPILLTGTASTDSWS